MGPKGPSGGGSAVHMRISEVDWGPKGQIWWWTGGRSRDAAIIRLHFRDDEALFHLERGAPCTKRAAPPPPPPPRGGRSRARLSRACFHTGSRESNDRKFLTPRRRGCTAVARRHRGGQRTSVEKHYQIPQVQIGFCTYRTYQTHPACWTAPAPIAPLRRYLNTRSLTFAEPCITLVAFEPLAQASDQVSLGNIILLSRSGWLIIF